jgi:putative lipoic acid-binding regulatory protein
VKEPKIEFPCEYPIKVIGEFHANFSQEILEIVRRYDSAVVPEKVKERPSSKGNYRSITIAFWATGEPQLKKLFADLMECPSVRMVL